MNMTRSSVSGAAAAAAGKPDGSDPNGQTRSLVSGVFRSLDLQVQYTTINSR